MSESPTFPATVTVHCPSGPTHACEGHRAKIQGLMSFLGAYTNVTVAPTGATCKNCENEFAKGASRNASENFVQGPASSFDAPARTIDLCAREGE